MFSFSLQAPSQVSVSRLQLDTAESTDGGTQSDDGELFY